MLNRELQTVSVKTFTADIDSYGQPRRTVASTRNVEMVVKIYSQSNQNSPIYNNVELLGITKDKTITDKNQIQIANVDYNILHVIPSGKYLQVLMKKV